MTTFFILFAGLQFFGLYAILFAMREAPVAIEAGDGFRPIEQTDEAGGQVAAAMARTA